MAKAPPHTAYPLLDQIQDPVLQRALKLVFDKIGNVEQLSTGIGTVSAPLTAHLDAAGNQLKAVANPTAQTDAVNLQYLKQYVAAAIALDKKVVPPVPVPGSPTVTPPIPAGTGSGLVCYTALAAGQPLGAPAAPNLRWWRGDFCGISVPGLPAVSGGAADASLVFSPFLDRYSAGDQAAIITAYKAKGYTHFALSWPDSRVSGGVGSSGQSIPQFVATCQSVQANGLYPCVFLTSKDFDPVDPNPASLDGIMAALIAGGCAPLVSVGWELDLFNTPGAPLQALIDHVTGTLVAAGTKVYVHFSAGIAAWQANGSLGSVFWAANVGKLTGILHQKPASWDCGEYQARIDDFMVRFGQGQAGWPQDSGFGHPFDFVAWEMGASARFAGGISEAQAQGLGNQAICTPAELIGSGPYAGQYYVVQGSGNGLSLA